jgi:hypothetical protein
MEIPGIDPRQRESRLSTKADERTITDCRIATNRDRFTAVLGGRPPARILYAMRRDDVPYDARRIRPKTPVAPPRSTPCANRDD